jgi:hypothetical protein
MGDEPREPMTELREAAAHLHEMFQTLKESGFTEWQACRILGVMLAEQNRQS